MPSWPMSAAPRHADPVLDRRGCLRLGAGLGLAVWVRPALATAAELDAAIRAYTGGPLPRAGRATLEIA